MKLSLVRYYSRRSVFFRFLVVVFAFVFLEGNALAYQTHISFDPDEFDHTEAEFASKILDENTPYLSLGRGARARIIVRLALIDPQQSEDCDTYSSLMLAKEDYDEAAHYLVKSIETSKGTDPERAVLYLRLSAIYIISDREYDALDCLNRALALAPDLSDAYLLRAQVHYLKGTNEKARADFLTYLTLTPDTPLIEADLGGLYELVEDYEYSVLCYSKAIESGNYDISDLSARGRCRALSGNSVLAINDFIRYFSEGGIDSDGTVSEMLLACRQNAPD